MKHIELLNDDLRLATTETLLPTATEGQCYSCDTGCNQCDTSTHTACTSCNTACNCDADNY
jgi:hypothetical protein